MGRRMFNPYVVNQDKFLDMPVSARELYFQLGMNADDDGFISPKRIMKMTNASDDDLKVLMAKEYLIPFETGVVCIAHWRVNNLVRKDWYRPTQFLEEKNRLVYKSGEIIRLKSLVNEPVNELVNVNNQITNKIYPEKEPENGDEELVRVEPTEAELKYQKMRSEINNLFKPKND